MKIYYGTSGKFDLIIQRLVDEGNTHEQIKAWMNRSVEIASLDEYINKTGCDTLNQMLAAGKVAYVITELNSDDDVFAYIGVN